MATGGDAHDTLDRPDTLDTLNSLPETIPFMIQSLQMRHISTFPLLTLVASTLPPMKDAPSTRTTSKRAKTRTAGR